MNKSLLLVSAGLLATALSAGVYADQDKDAKRCEHHKKGSYMTRLDTNKDGVVSREEYVANAEKRFSKLDANNDGMIDKDEMKNKHMKHKKDKNRKMDDKS